MIRFLLIFVLALSFITVSLSGISMAQGGPPNPVGPPNGTKVCQLLAAIELQSCVYNAISQEETDRCIDDHNSALDICLNGEG